MTEEITILDEVKVEEVVEESTEEKVEQPIEKQEEKEEQSSIDKQAGYFSRHPDKFEELVNKVKTNKTTDKGQMALDEMHKLQMQLAAKDAVIDFGLSKEDFKFIHGNTPNELRDNAKAFAEYKKSLSPDESSNKTDNTAVKKEPEKSFEYPTYSKNPETANMSLKDQFLHDMPEKVEL